MNQQIRSREFTSYVVDHKNACWNEPTNVTSNDCSSRSNGKTAAHSGLMLLQNGIDVTACEQRSQESGSWRDSAQTNLSPMKRELVSDMTIANLLQLLRTEEFAGTIDLEHHSRYLSPPGHDTSNKKSVSSLFPLNEINRKRSGDFLNANEVLLKKAKSSTTRGEQNQWIQQPLYTESIKD